MEARVATMLKERGDAMEQYVAGEMAKIAKERQIQVQKEQEMQQKVCEMQREREIQAQRERERQQKEWEMQQRERDIASHLQQQSRGTPMPTQEAPAQAGTSVEGIPVQARTPTQPRRDQGAQPGQIGKTIHLLRQKHRRVSGKTTLRTSPAPVRDRLCVSNCTNLTLNQLRTNQQCAGGNESNSDADSDAERDVERDSDGAWLIAALKPVLVPALAEALRGCGLVNTKAGSPLGTKAGRSKPSRTRRSKAAEALRLEKEAEKPEDRKIFLVSLRRQCQGNHSQIK